ncbi:hypothetical protein [Duncaniella muris]|uniref:hypothetical protein n=1 Tax=Duncaniella muris TaxID=2094150 RepID=UPI003F676EA1
MPARKEYIKVLGIKNTQYLVVAPSGNRASAFPYRHNRVGYVSKAVNERNNFRRSDRVVKAIKDKYGLTYSPLKQKYEDKIQYLRSGSVRLIYGCKSWMSSRAASPVPELR